MPKPFEEQVAEQLVDLRRRMQRIESNAYNLVPLFSAYKSGTTSNVTGDGTTYDVVYGVEAYDVGNNYNLLSGIFTAPVTGKYLFCGAVALGGLTSSHTDGNMRIITTIRTYICNLGDFFAMSNSSAQLILPFSTIADMDKSDTCFVRIQVSGGSLVVDALGQNPPVVSWFQGAKLR